MSLPFQSFQAYNIKCSISRSAKVSDIELRQFFYTKLLDQR